MAAQERKPTQRTDKKQEVEASEVAEDTDATETTDKIDDLLEEIDSVLEENAEEFVKNYVQKGGE
ncbi:MAG: ubiquitin-like protein Pup [Acidimicrobiia bacterium]|nr:ubiquitin-like protein Pup [Acidimicrobiia bacterium]